MALCARNAHITVDDVRRAMQRRVLAAQCRCAMLSRDVTAAIARCDCSYRAMCAIHHAMCAIHHAMYHSYHAMYRSYRAMCHSYRVMRVILRAM